MYHPRAEETHRIQQGRIKIQVWLHSYCLLILKGLYQIHANPLQPTLALARQGTPVSVLSHSALTILVPQTLETIQLHAVRIYFYLTSDKEKRV